MTTPWFPLYAPDFLASTMSMPPEVVGAYIRLLCWSWMNGPIPGDLPALNRITGGITPAGWDEIRARLVPDGQRDGDRDGDREQRWVHPRMERERTRTDSITKARRDAAKATNAKRRDGQRSGDRSGQRDGERSGDRAADRPYPQPQLHNTPHPSGGGAGGGEGVVSAKQGTKQPAVSSVAARRSPVARPNGSDGSTPHPTPSDATGGIPGDVALRDPTPAEMDRITRWPGSRTVPPVALEGKRRVLVRMLREKKVSAEYLAPAWEAALREWGERGTDPYDFVANTLLGEWEGVRFPDAVMKHRLGMGAA